MSISQNFPIEGPSLNLNFTHSRTLDSRITFSRTSVGTCINENGMVTTVPAGSPRFDHRITSTENLLLWSENFDVSSSWGATNVTITANNSTSPTGTLTADLITASITASDRLLGQFVSIPTNTASYTGSFFVKRATYRYFTAGLYFGGGTTQEFSIRVDLDLGTLTTTSGSVANSTITSVGDGWYRVSFTQPNNGTNTSIRMSLRPLASGALLDNTVASNALIWGSQIELGTVATPYIPTTTAKVESIDVESMGLLVEEQRTNLQVYSGIPSANWSTTNSPVVTSNSAISPDGTVNATQIAGIAQAASGIYQFTPTLTANTVYTYSLFLKAISGSNTIYFGSDSGTSATVQVNMSTGVATSNSGATVSNIVSTPYSNGWYRISFQFSAAQTAAHSFVIYNLTASANTWLAWGAQVEAGSFVTSYIPTVASTVTRTPDIVSIDGTKFSSWYDQLEGTTVAEVENAGTRSNNFSVPIGYRTTFLSSANTIEVFQQNGSFYYLVRTSPPQTDHVGFDVPLTSRIGSYIKYGFSYKQNDFSYFINNTLYTDTVGTIPTGIIVAAIGSNNNTYMNGRIKSIQYYPYRMSDLQLRELCK